MSNQYDIDPEMKRLFELKQKQRAEAKEYFQKLLYNPYRPVGDGAPFDPLIVRFNALNTYRSRLYEATPKFYFKVFLTLIPIFLTYGAIEYIGVQKEKYFRSGLVKYEDRFNRAWM